jgi:LysR family transcriptional regulator, cell division regulator
MLPNPNDLTFFLEVGKTKNISRAAERLGVTQSALSQGMKRLEGTMGVPLLVRVKTGVHLTRAGEKLFIEGRELLIQWEKIREETLRDDQKISGSYRVGVHEALALYTMPKILPRLLTKYPKLEIELVHNLSRKVTEEVISFKLDFALVVNPIPHPDLVIVELFKDEVSFWQASKVNKLNDWDSEDLVIIYHPEMVQVQDLMAKIRKKKNGLFRSITSNNLHVIRFMAIDGAGVGIVPTRVLGGDLKKVKKVEGLPSYKDRICLVHRVDSHKGEGMRELLSKFKELLLAL